VEWGIVDTNTGASNRHLEILASLGALGHKVYRGNVRARRVTEDSLPPLARNIFDGYNISLVKNKLYNYPAKSAQPFKRLVENIDPDVIILTLWFCGETLHDSTPGYLLDAFRESGHRAKIIVESSDVHSVVAARWQLEGQKNIKVTEGDHLSKTKNHPRKRQQREHLNLLSNLESYFYKKSDAVISISYEDRTRMEIINNKEIPIRVMRYISLDPPPMCMDDCPPHGLSYEERSGYVFVGPLATITNWFAIEWFLSDVWEQLFNMTKLSKDGKRPTLTIVGVWNMRGVGARRATKKGPSTAVAKALACHRAVNLGKGTPIPACEGAFSHIRFAGKLPTQQMSEVLGRARVFVSPIVFSTGVNTKNLLAMEHSLPLITTSKTGGLCILTEANGNPYDHCGGGGRNELNLPFLVADGPQPFAEAAMRAHDDKELWHALSKNGRQHAQKLLTVELAARDIDLVLKDVQAFGQ